MRFALALAIFLAPSLTTAQDAGAPPPEPRIPAFVPPSDYIVGLPEPRHPASIDGAICYDEVTHLRLAVALGLVEPASTQRAREAWSMGYIDGVRASAGTTAALRGDLRSAEAQAAEATAEARHKNGMIWATGGAGVLVGAVVAALIVWGVQ